MTDTAISVEGLSKRYRIGLEEERHDTLFGAAASWLRSPAENYRRLRRLSHFDEEDESDVIWALRDVSFEVSRGAVVGVIGRNGAGKSTLLKILSRITEPSAGHVDIYGRVSSLLEVGTGFHPELTGRENVFLNGSVLGMRAGEIRRKFDEIVAFSGVEKFIDTPVKRYSSGMNVRLAFSVAAHLEPEILLVDEVLAVGDAGFQKKCLGKMGEVAGAGRSVLFVSHQLGMISSLCQEAILVESGRLVQRGPSSQVIDAYLGRFVEDQTGRASVSFDENVEGKAQILDASLENDAGEPTARFDVFEKIRLRMTYVVREPLEGVAANLVVYRNSEILFVSFDTDDQPELLTRRSPGYYRTWVDLPSPLKAGRYSIDLTLGVLNLDGVDVRRDALVFDIEERSFDTSMASYSSRRPGSLAAHLRWDTRREAAVVRTAPDLTG